MHADFDIEAEKANNEKELNVIKQFYTLYPLPSNVVIRNSKFKNR